MGKIVIMDLERSQGRNSSVRCGVANLIGLDLDP
jgi:hypothetical protein